MLAFSNCVHGCFEAAELHEQLVGLCYAWRVIQRTGIHSELAI